MTVRELIECLLNCAMDSEVKIYLRKPHKDEFVGEIEGFLYDIDNINKHPGLTELEFSDARISVN